MNPGFIMSYATKLTTAFSKRAAPVAFGAAAVRCATTAATPELAATSSSAASSAVSRAVASEAQASFGARVSMVIRSWLSTGAAHGLRIAAAVPAVALVDSASSWQDDVSIDRLDVDPEELKADPALEATGLHSQDLSAPLAYTGNLCGPRVLAQVVERPSVDARVDSFLRVSTFADAALVARTAIAKVSDSVKLPVYASTAYDNAVASVKTASTRVRAYAVEKASSALVVRITQSLAETVSVVAAPSTEGLDAEQLKESAELFRERRDFVYNMF